MENSQIAEIFEEIADLLELRKDNEFRIRAYRNVAQSIRSLSARIEDMVEHGESLSQISDIGSGTAEKILEILERGTTQRLEDLRKTVPKGLTTLMRVPGLGAKRVMLLNQELDVSSLEGLKRACEAHRVREIEGLGEKTEEKILRGIATLESAGGRVLYTEAAEQLDSLSAHLNKIEEIERWEVAGSFRRGQETIGDLDILIRAKDREKTSDRILQYRPIVDVTSRGKERLSVRLENGLQVDFRYFDPPSFGTAWLYFTGSKAHNIKLRRIAQDYGWKLNEYGLSKGDRRLAGETEESVYERLKLSWIPPEMREDAGEIEAAREGRIPQLVEIGDIRGDFQSHTIASDGRNSIEEMANAARKLGFSYLAVTDHSKRVTMAKGLDDKGAKKHASAIRELSEKLPRFWLLAGIEVDILKDGRLDLAEETLESMDWVVASVHYDRAMTRKAMTERVVRAVKSGVVHCLGHPLGRIIGKRDPIAVDIDQVVEACVENNVWIEINCQADRLDLPDNYCRAARSAGARFVLSTDAHSTDGLRRLPLGVMVARRSWLTKEHVLNTRSIAQLKKALRRS